MCRSLFSLLFLLIVLITGCGSSRGEREPNNSFAQALPVTSGDSVSGEIHKRHDRDIFRIKIQGTRYINRVIHLRLNHKAKSDLRIVVFKDRKVIKIIDDFCRPSGISRGKNRPTGASVKEEMANLALYPGDYYFAVQAAPGGHGVFPAPYTLHFIQESRSEFSEIEPNDTLKTATSIEPGVSMEGYLSPLGNAAGIGYRERDYYKLSLTATNKTVVDVKVTGIPGTDIVVSLFDNRGALIRRSDANGMHMGESISKLGIKEGGDYFISVHAKNNYRGSHTAPYTIRIDVESYQKGQEMEPNDSIREANPVSTGQKISGFCNRVGDKDLYSFTVPQPGKYIFSARLKGVSDVDTYLQVFDAKGNRLTSINLKGAGEAEYIANLPLRTTVYDQPFYILVGSRTGKNNEEPYELYLGVHEANLMGEFGDNNSRERANILHLDMEKKGFIYPQGDRDWFSFSLQENRHVNISLSGVSGVDFIFRLYDKDGKQLRSVNGSGANEGESIITDLPGPGLYFLRVACTKDFQANAREPYSLKIRSSQPRTLPRGITVKQTSTTNTDTVQTNTSSDRDAGSTTNNTSGGE